MRQPLTQGFEQVVAFGAHHLADVGDELHVVDRVLDTVGTSCGGQIELALKVHGELLVEIALLLGHAVAA